MEAAHASSLHLAVCEYVKLGDLPAVQGTRSEHGMLRLVQIALHSSCTCVALFSFR